jgi:hypothetical protein
MERFEDMIEQRDSEGKLTRLAMALHALADHGCDCGTDEPGTCLGCLCEAALREQFESLGRLSSKVEQREVVSFISMGGSECGPGDVAVLRAEMTNKASVKEIFFSPESCRNFEHLLVMVRDVGTDKGRENLVIEAPGPLPPRYGMVHLDWMSLREGQVVEVSATNRSGDRATLKGSLVVTIKEEDR